MMSQHNRPRAGALNVAFAAVTIPEPLKPIDTVTPLAGFRRLHKNEVVSRGDYVLNQFHGVEAWEGPGGFRAGSFVKRIYRRVPIKPLATQVIDE
jgi:hypothetical protein